MPESILGPDGEPLNLAPAPPDVSPGGPVLAEGESPPPVVDADAPFGRKADGTPRARPGPKPGRHDRPRVQSAPEPAPGDADDVRTRRVTSVTETMHVAAISCLSMHAATGKDSWEADAHVLANNAAAFAASCAELAAVNPAFARFIDSGGKGAAYFAFGSVAASLGAQLAVNHGLLKPGFLGTRSVGELITPEPEASPDGTAHTEE